MSMQDFDKFVSSNKDRRMSVTKVKTLNNPEMRGGSMIPDGEPFVGQVTLRWVDESNYGSGFLIMVGGGYVFRSSLVREVAQKSPTKWLAKTMNSVYRVEVLE